MERGERSQGTVPQRVPTRSLNCIVTFSCSSSSPSSPPLSTFTSTFSHLFITSSLTPHCTATQLLISHTLPAFPLSRPSSATVPSLLWCVLYSCFVLDWHPVSRCTHSSFPLTPSNSSSNALTHSIESHQAIFSPSCAVSK